MKIWSVVNNTVGGYDTYDSIVVAAETEEAARLIFPGYWYRTEKWDGQRTSEWGAAKDNIVEYIGHTDRDGMEEGIICASFNAG